MIGEIRQNFTEASASVGLILATALVSVTKSLNGTGHKKGKQTYVYLAAVYLGNEVNDSVLRIMDC